jgi:hypothetical protein
MKDDGCPLARHNDMVIQELQGEVLVYDIKSNKAHCLNSTAAFVWKCCDGGNSVPDIVRQFDSAGKGKVTEDLVWLAIDQLNESGLLANDIPPRFEKRTRRQVLKSIGFASVVALPVIASLVAPRSSLGSVNCTCAISSNCVTQVTCPSQTNCNVNSLCAP